MADTAVAVTAGSGTNIDTRTEATNGNHRQVVVLGDPSDNSGVAPVDATAGLKVNLGTDNDVTVTGTVTADLGATDNAVLDAIAASTLAIETAVEGTLTVTGGGGGIQYTEGDTDATITGTAALVEGAANALAVMTQPLTDTQLRASAVPVSATDLDIRNLTNTDVVTAELSAVDNAVLDTIAAKDFATQATLSAINAKLVSGTDIGDVTINNASGVSAVNIQDGGNTITVDGTVGVSGTVTVGSHDVTNAGTFAVQNTAATPAGTNNIGDVDVLTVNGVAPAFGTGVRGATVQRVTIATDDSVPVTNSGITTIAGAVSGTEMQVDVLTMPTVTVNSHAVTNAGTFATQVDGAALTALQLIDDPVFADDAAFTLSTSKGNVIAGVAVNTDGTDPTAVSAEGDAAAVRTDVNRILLVNETHPRFWHVSADYASAQTNTSVKASPGASLSLYITDIQISNGATAGNITLLDGSGGTVLYEVYPGITGGAVLSLRSPIKLTAATALCITSTTVTTHSIFVSGYIAP